MNMFLGFICLIAIANLPDGYAMEKYRLSSGYYIPVVGLGTSGMKPNEIEPAILSALDSGYRHIDTAFLYDNEQGIGRALKKWYAKGGKREDLFITSKLPSHANKPEKIEKYLKLSLQYLGTDYVDMYLIHKPFGLKEGENNSPKKENGNVVFESIDHLALWKEMEKQVKKGRAKSIGLSNFNQTQVWNVYKNAKIKPSNLQIETHPYLQQKQLRQFCKQNNIVVTAFAPLASPHTVQTELQGYKLIPLIEVPLIKELAEKYDKSPSQIILRSTTQDGLVVIPKSVNPQRQRSNKDLFDFKLNNEDMKKMEALDKGERGRVFDFTNYYPGIQYTAEYPFKRA